MTRALLLLALAACCAGCEVRIEVKSSPSDSTHTMFRAALADSLRRLP